MLRVTKGGDLHTLDIGGSLLGSINGPDVVHQRITIGGDLGAVGVSHHGIRVDKDIKYIEVGGDVNGIISNLYFGIPAFGGLTGSIGRIKVDGDFNGVLETESDGATPPAVSEGGVFIEGDLNGSLTFREGLTRKLLVDGSFGEDATINLPANGLQGQITFNRAAGSAGWSGEILFDDDADEVYDIPLVEEYSDLPSTIGGGAAGVAPFNPIHESTASPSNNHIRFITGIDIFDPMMSCEDLPDFEDPISFRLYGPVSLVSGTGPHAKVEKWDGSAWVSAGFEVTTTIVSGTGSRGLRFVRSDQDAWPRDFAQYRITPASGRIVSVDVLGTPTASFEYFIEIADGCGLSLLAGFDLNNDGELCAADLAAWTANPVDLNADETVCSQDAALLLSAISAYQNLD